ncbi:hypothetical protein DIPPA_23454 [Diplonema papillatum]|nr:hypothetical protein DIPPA_23454 [Diplonema papillatum]
MGPDDGPSPFRHDWSLASAGRPAADGPLSPRVPSNAQRTMLVRDSSLLSTSSDHPSAPPPPPAAEPAPPSGHPRFDPTSPFAGLSRRYANAAYPAQTQAQALPYDTSSNPHYGQGVQATHDGKVDGSRYAREWSGGVDDASRDRFDRPRAGREHPSPYRNPSLCLDFPPARDQKPQSDRFSEFSAVPAISSSSSSPHLEPAQHPDLHLYHHNLAQHRILHKPPDVLPAAHPALYHPPGGAVHHVPAVPAAGLPPSAAPQQDFSDVAAAYNQLAATHQQQTAAFEAQLQGLRAENDALRRQAKAQCLAADARLRDFDEGFRSLELQVKELQQQNFVLRETLNDKSSDGEVLKRKLSERLTAKEIDFNDLSRHAEVLEGQRRKLLRDIEQERDLCRKHTSQTKELQSELNRAVDDLANLQRMVQVSDARQKILKEKNAELQALVNGLEKDRAVLRQDVAGLQKECAAQQGTAEALERALKEAEAILVEQKAERNRLEDTIDALEDHKRELERNAHEAEVLAEKAEVEARRADRLSIKIQTLEHRDEQANQELNDSKTEYGEMSRGLEEASRDNAVLKESLRRAETDFASCHIMMKTAKETLRAVEEEATQLREQQRVMVRSFEEMQGELERCREQKLAAAAHIKELEYAVQQDKVLVGDLHQKLNSTQPSAQERASHRALEQRLAHENESLLQKLSTVAQQRDALQKELQMRNAQEETHMRLM